MRRLAPWLSPLILLLLALFPAACRKEAPRLADGRTTPLKFLFTSDTAGALDPCG
jgi:hypothetical protein